MNSESFDDLRLLGVVVKLNRVVTAVGVFKDFREFNCFAAFVRDLKLLFLLLFRLFLFIGLLLFLGLL